MWTRGGESKADCRRWDWANSFVAWWKFQEGQRSVLCIDAIPLKITPPLGHIYFRTHSDNIIFRFSVFSYIIKLYTLFGRCYYCCCCCCCWRWWWWRVTIRLRCVICFLWVKLVYEFIDLKLNQIIKKEHKSVNQTWSSDSIYDACFYFQLQNCCKMLQRMNVKRGVQKWRVGCVGGMELYG